jgi:hypothetical protein
LLVFKWKNQTVLVGFSYHYFSPGVQNFPERYSYLNIDLNAANIATEIFTTDLAEYEREVDERIDLIRHSPKDSVVVKK